MGSGRSGDGAGAGAAWLAMALALALAQAQGTEDEGEGECALQAQSLLYAVAAAAEVQEEAGGVCAHHLRLLRRALDHRLLWALKMLDSSGSPGSGFLWGNNFWLGSRGQCEDANNHAPYVLVSNFNLYDSGSSNNTYPPFEVQFQVATFQHNVSTQMHVRLPNENLLLMGLCMPQGCSAAQLHRLIEECFRNSRPLLLVQRLFNMDLQLQHVRQLGDNGEWLWKPGFLIVATTISVLLLLLTFGTIYHLTMQQPPFNNDKAISGAYMSNGSVDRKKTFMEYSHTSRFFLNFSIYSNTAIIFNTELGAESIPAIHGLRFLGMCWILMAHTVYYLCDFADNKPMTIRLSEGFFAQVLGNATLSVDTFFFLSGFLVSYVFYTVESSSQTTKTSLAADVKLFFTMVLRRFIRLTPPYILTIGIVYVNATWYTKTSLFITDERADITCAKYWWRNLLYINNLFSRKEMCMSWSWYLSNDMQFFTVASFLLIISKRSFSTSAGILFSSILLSSLTTGYVAYTQNYIPTLDSQYTTLDTLYDRPWARMGPHLVGVATGFIAVKLNRKLTLGKTAIVFLWIVGSICNIVALFGLSERHISPIAAAIYVALSRTAWGIGIAWIVIACCTNHGGIINKILSFHGWVPLSRLTYCAYLVNPMLMTSVYLSSHRAQHIEFLPTGTFFLGHICICYCCSYILSVLIESPTILLLKQLLGKRNTHQVDSSTSSNSTRL